MRPLSRVDVGIGQVEFARDHGVLQARGLGSCVGLVIYDRNTHRAGMAHVFLDSPANDAEATEMPGKFASTAVPFLVAQLSRTGSSSGLEAYLAGGARLFNFTAPQMDIGRRNAAVVRRLLRHHAVPVLLDDTGGEYGRSMEFDVATGQVRVVSLKKELSL